MYTKWIGRILLVFLCLCNEGLSFVGFRPHIKSGRDESSCYILETTDRCAIGAVPNKHERSILMKNLSARWNKVSSWNDGDHREDNKIVEEVKTRTKHIEVAEVVSLAIWMAALSAFILVNNFMGPWPEVLMKAVPVKIWLILHFLGEGLLFGGGIIMTTLLEWMVASSKNKSVVEFWFSKVPLLDTAIVLPGLTLTIIAGTGVSISYYGGLGHAPKHILMAFHILAAFAIWWAATDLTTQQKTAIAIDTWVAKKDQEDIPRIIHLRKISNLVSCGFIVLLYGIMTLKPGF